MSKPLAWRSAVISVVCLLLGFGSGMGQPKSDDLPQIPGIDIKPPSVPPAVAPPVPATVDELINQLEKVREQKAALEKQERAITEQLKGRLKQQGDRLSKLGVVLTPPAPPEPPRIDIPGPAIKEAFDNAVRPPAAK